MPVLRLWCRWPPSSRTSTTRRGSCFEADLHRHRGADARHRHGRQRGGVQRGQRVAVQGIRPPAAHDGVGRIATTPRDDRGAATRRSRNSSGSRDAAKGVARLAAEGRSTIAGVTTAPPKPPGCCSSSPDYFSMVDAPVRRRPAPRGTATAPTCRSGDRRAVLAREARRAHRSPDLTLRLNNTDVSVAGVMPESFTGPAGIYSPDIWLPLEDVGAVLDSSATLQRRDTRWLFLMARAERRRQRRADAGHLDTAVAEMAREWPDTHKGPRRAVPACSARRNSERRGIATAGGDRHGHHRPRAAARLLQRRQPAAGARGRARTRHGHSRRARRQARRG